MQILSAPPWTFVKRVLPFVVVVSACAHVYWPERNEGVEPLVLAFVLLVIANFIMYRTLRKGSWRRADTVEDLGDHLVVTRWKTTITIPLSQVQEVMEVPTLGGMEVVITLKTPCVFGSEIAFFPLDKRKVPEIEHALDMLKRRVLLGNARHEA